MGQRFFRRVFPKGPTLRKKQNVRKNMCTAPSPPPLNLGPPKHTPYKGYYCQTLGCRHGGLLRDGVGGSFDWFFFGGVQIASVQLGMWPRQKNLEGFAPPPSIDGVQQFGSASALRAPLSGPVGSRENRVPGTRYLSQSKT